MLKIDSNGSSVWYEVHGTMDVLVNDLLNVVGQIANDLASNEGVEEGEAVKKMFAAMVLVSLQEIWKDIPDLEQAMKVVKKHMYIARPSEGARA